MPFLKGGGSGGGIAAGTGAIVNDDVNASANLARSKLLVLPRCAARHSANQGFSTSTETVTPALDTEIYDTDNMMYQSAANLTGTVAKTAASAAVVGTGTAFTTELSVGQLIIIPGTASEKRVVTVITDDTHLTVSAIFANSASGQTASRASNGIVFRTAGLYWIWMDIWFSHTSSQTAIADGYFYKMVGAVETVILTVEAHPGGATSIIVGGRAYTFAQWDFIELRTFTNGASPSFLGNNESYGIIGAHLII